MTGPGRLVATDVHKTYGDLIVLQGLSLDVPAGGTTALLGPSGCGKSTLLRVLAGFIPVDAGTVTVNGEPVLGPSPSRGMVAQTSSLFPWLTVYDNIAFGPRERQERSGTAVQQMLALTGLSDFKDALPRQLSGGMRQRAAFAQVLVNEPPLLLLDEPFAALDAQTRLRLQEWTLHVLRERPTTTVLVTHDVDEALLLGDKLGMLTARPSRVQREVPLTFGHRRGRQTLLDPAFLALKGEVLNQVLGA